MTKSKKQQALVKRSAAIAGYNDVLAEVVDLLESARRASARAINSAMAATYWEIGRRIVEYEQQGKKRAEYGEDLIKRLGADLTARLGRGFGWRNLFQMRAFYLAHPNILQTLSAKFADQSEQEEVQTLSVQSEKSLKPPRKFDLPAIAHHFPLPWSHYVKLLAIKNPNARAFYEAEALRGGWSIRQLARQINSMFYERTALSRDKATMLRKGQKALPVKTWRRVVAVSKI